LAVNSTCGGFNYWAYFARA